MTAAHALAGMYPPHDQQIWNDALIWQAIPIHTIPFQSDYVLGMVTPCPLYNQTYEEYENSDEIKSMIKENEHLFKYLSKHVGTKVSSICEVKTIYEALWLEELKNLT